MKMNFGPLKSDKRKIMKQPESPHESWPSKRHCDKSFCASPRKKILVVDYSPVCRNVLKRIVEQGGYKCQTACDGAEALEELERNPNEFCAILIDFRMPVLDGIETTKRAREKLFVTAPIIALSSSTRDNPLSYIEAGANVFIPKPAKPSRILSELESLVNIPIPAPKFASYVEM